MFSHICAGCAKSERMLLLTSEIAAIWDNNVVTTFKAFSMSIFLSGKIVPTFLLFGLMKIIVHFESQSFSYSFAF